MTDRYYTLQMNETQAQMISRACELYARFTMGQFDCLTDFAPSGKDGYEVGRELEHAVKAIIGPPLGRTNAGNNAWDIYQVVRHRIAWEREPGGGFTVDFGTPLRTGIEPLAQCISSSGKQPEIEKSGIRLAKEIEEELGTESISEALRIIRELKAAIPPIDPAKQCYHDEGQCKCQTPSTCVIDNGKPHDCSYAVILAATGQDRNDCVYWGKR